ncbi:hypothetical protein [Streptomyces sp. NPDC056468]|uniref:hypothetical protein n=1 Tax=Streptomyces sp. NPDC056468 TaxID=3345830 RepID=UPI0036994633
MTWALAGAQLWDEAEDFVAQIPDRHEQAESASLLAGRLLDSGRLTAAARLLRLAQPGGERDRKYVRLAEQLDEFDSWDETRAAITAVDTSEMQAAALDSHLRRLAAACREATGETRTYLEGLTRSLVAEIVVTRGSLQPVGMGAAALPEEAQAAAWAAYRLIGLLTGESPQT